MIAQYLDTKAVSPSTRRLYHAEIVRFEQLGRDGYTAYLRDNLRPASIALKLACVNGYLVWKGDEPLAVPRPKIPRTVPVSFSEAEQQQMLATIDRRSWRGKRDHAVLSVLFGTGLRLAELCNLDHDDLHPAPGGYDLVVRGGKGGDDRVVPLMGEPLESVLSYLRAPVRGFREDEAALFLMPSYGGTTAMRRISRRAVQHLVDQARKKAGLPGRPRSLVHACRHSFAMSMYRSSRDVLAVSHALGHRSVQTTQTYARADTGVLREAMQGMAVISGSGTRRLREVRTTTVTTDRTLDDGGADARREGYS